MLILLFMACLDSEPAPPFSATEQEDDSIRVDVGKTSATQSSALSAYDEAMAFRQQKEWSGAVTAFQRAIQEDTDSPSLRLWLAQTHLDMGREDQALSVLDEAVRLFPKNSDCLYNRAALRARMLDVGGAADDLQRLNSLGLLDPLETGMDPDFEALRTDPVFHHLVQPPRIEAVVKGETGPVLLGEPWQLHLSLTVPANGELSMEWVEEPEPWVVLDSVLEREVHREGGLRVLELRVRWLAATAGTGMLGPWRLRLGSAETIVEALPVEVLSLRQRDSLPHATLARQIPLPSAVIQQAEGGGDFELAEWRGEVSAPEKTRFPRLGNGRVSLEWRQENGSFRRAAAIPK